MDEFQDLLTQAGQVLKAKPFNPCVILLVGLGGRHYEFTGFKRESRAAFCTAASLFNEYILNVMYLVGICICYVF